MAFYHIIFLAFLLPFTLSSFCYNSYFSPILVNKENKIELGPNTESCYKYSLSSNDTKIILVFPRVLSSTSEVLLYNKKPDYSVISGSEYKNYIDRFLINENNFKEVNLKDFSSEIYIILRDAKYSKIYNNFFILYDTEIPITLKEGKPLTIKYFVKNNEYKFDFSSKKSLTFIYSTKVKSKKYISVTYNNKTILPKSIDNSDQIFNLKSENETMKRLYITVEDIEEGIEDQEFSVIVYEKNINQFFEIKQGIINTINYLNLNQGEEKQIFFFYYKIGEYTKTNTINFKLDPEAKASKYIYIESGIYHSNKEIPDEEKAAYFRFFENSLPVEYDINSDEYKKIYFQDSLTSYQYRYIFFKIEISKLEKYFSPKNIIITVGPCVEEKNLKYLQYYKAETITLNTKEYIPSYIKINLNPTEKYILTSPYPENTIFTKGDLVIKDDSVSDEIKINNNYFMDQDEIIILSDISEITISLLKEKNVIAKFYLEKYEEGNVHIIENYRNYDPFQVRFTDEECKNGIKKYLLGIYNKNIYNKYNRTYTKYWTSEYGDFDVYYRNSIILENNNLFPNELKYIKKKEYTILLNFNIDFFTFSCIKPGTLYLRSPYKVFNETTHHIGQNSYTYIDISNKLEIIQLSSPMRPNSDYLYFGIFSKYGKKIKIWPDYPTLFDETSIQGDDCVYLIKIDLYRYEPDQLAIKILAEESTSIEVVEVIKYNFTEYTVVNNEKMNHFSDNHLVKFIEPKTKVVKFNLNGLKDVTISYGLVQLFTDDINYLPVAYNFKENTIKRMLIKNDEKIEIDNPFLGKEEKRKKYIAFIFSISSYKFYEYDAQIIEDDIDKEESNINVILISIIVFIALSVIVGIIIYFLLKNKGNKKSELENKIHKFDDEDDDNDKKLYKSINDD